MTRSEDEVRTADGVDGVDNTCSKTRKISRVEIDNENTEAVLNTEIIDELDLEYPISACNVATAIDVVKKGGIVWCQDAFVKHCFAAAKFSGHPFQAKTYKF